MSKGKSDGAVLWDGVGTYCLHKLSSNRPTIEKNAHLLKCVCVKFQPSVCRLPEKYLIPTYVLVHSHFLLVCYYRSRCDNHTAQGRTQDS